MIIDHGDGYHDYRVSFIVLVLQHVIPDQASSACSWKVKASTTYIRPSARKKTASTHSPSCLVVAVCSSNDHPYAVVQSLATAMPCQSTSEALASNHARPARRSKATLS